MSFDVERADYHERRNRKPRTVDKTKSMEAEVNSYPERGRTTPLERVQAGLNLSLWFHGSELAELQMALGVPTVVSKRARKA